MSIEIVCLRGLADDRYAATALPLHLVEPFFSLYSPSWQTSLCSDCPGRALSQRSPCPVPPRCAWNGTRLRAASSDGAPGGSRHELRCDCRLPPFFILPRPASGRPHFPRTPGSVDSPSGVARPPLSPPKVGDRRLRALILSLFVGATHA